MHAHTAKAVSCVVMHYNAVGVQCCRVCGWRIVPALCNSKPWVIMVQCGLRWSRDLWVGGIGPVTDHTCYGISEGSSLNTVKLNSVSALQQLPLCPKPEWCPFSYIFLNSGILYSVTLHVKTGHHGYTFSASSPPPVAAEKRACIWNFCI